jgi:hypothetical protein
MSFLISNQKLQSYKGVEFFVAPKYVPDEHKKDVSEDPHELARQWSVRHSAAIPDAADMVYFCGPEEYEPEDLNCVSTIIDPVPVLPARDQVFCQEWNTIKFADVTNDMWSAHPFEVCPLFLKKCISLQQQQNSKHRDADDERMEALSTPSVFALKVFDHYSLSLSRKHWWMPSHVVLGPIVRNMCFDYAGVIHRGKTVVKIIKELHDRQVDFKKRHIAIAVFLKTGLVVID